MNAGHLRTILWLRWRLTRNQWSRGGSVNAVLAIVVLVAGCIIGCIGSVVGLLVGAFVLDTASPWTLLAAWDVLILVFLFFWMIGIVSEIQRSEVIDIGRMLHLPVSLKDIFLVNYLASHLTPSIILFLPGMVGLTLGLALGRGAVMLVMLPLTLGFIFMITAWTYCLRGWLVTLMSNPRRRRAVIAGVTFSFILLTQLPNFLNVMHNHKGRRSKPAEVVQSDEQAEAEPESQAPSKKAIPPIILTAHKAVPFLWVGNGAMALGQGHALPAALGTVGMLGLGALGLRRAYRSTIHFYQGRTKIKRHARKPKAERPTAPGRFLERRIPGVPDEAAALTLAFLRSLSRASEVKMMLATNLLMLLFFGAMILLRRSADIANDVKPFFATGAIVFTFFGLVQLMFNLFGMDRGGFRALVLLPVPRRQILLGKNLAFLPIAVVIGFVLLTLIKFAQGISFVVMLAAILQLFAAFFLLSMLGNLISALVPHRVAPGSLKPTKMSTLTTFLLMVSRLLFPLAMAPLFLAPGIGLLMSRAGWLPAAPVNLLVSALLLGLLALAYRLSLNPLGDLLQQREKRILDIVTQEVE